KLIAKNEGRTEIYIVSGNKAYSLQAHVPRMNDGPTINLPEELFAVEPTAESKNVHASYGAKLSDEFAIPEEDVEADHTPDKEAAPAEMRKFGEELQFVTKKLPLQY